MRLGVIGYGASARALLSLLADGRTVRQATVLLRKGGQIDGKPDGLRLDTVATFDALLAARPDLLVECAGHSAVQDHAEPTLLAGIAFLPLSLGAFADPSLLDRVQAATRRTRARLIRPAGAIAGIDLIEALSLQGDVRIAYTGTKPPQAWRGTAAEAKLDLAALTTATEFFSGTAREAALLFPKSTNVVAALALAGPGFENVSVRLVADPSATTNHHAYQVGSPGCEASFSIRSGAVAGNSRTSMTTVYSLLREIQAFASILPPN